LNNRRTDLQIDKDKKNKKKKGKDKKEPIYDEDFVDLLE